MFASYFVSPMNSGCGSAPRKRRSSSMCVGHDDGQTNRHAGFAELRRGLPRLAQDRLHQFRRAGRPDRHDAPHAGRREKVDRRAAFPARAQFLHAAAGAGGAEARDLHRLGAARRARRARRRHPVRAAGRAGDAGLEPRLCARARRRVDRRRAVRHQGRGAGDRGRGADPHRQARAEDPTADRARRRGVRRHLLSQRAVPADRRGRGADRLSGGALGAAADGPEGRGCRPRARCAGPLAAVLPRGRHRRDRLVGAGRACGARARPRACAGEHRHVLLQARGGELRRRLRAARLHGAAGGRDASLDDRARDGRRPRPRRDHAGAAHSGDAVRRLSRGFRDAAPFSRSWPAFSAPR